MTEVNKVNTDKAVKPQGHYSQAVVHNGVVYVAMQIGVDPIDGPVKGDISEQAKVALNNVKEILKEAGSDLSKVLRVTVYVSDISLWEQVNEVYSQFFGEHKPARGIVPCGKLHLGMDVGLEVTAGL